MGAQRRQRGKPQYAGPHLRFSGCAGRRSAWFSLLPLCQTASAFRLICLFHTFFRCGVYRAMVFAPLRCPELFRFPFACLRAALFNCFAHRLVSIKIRVICQPAEIRCFGGFLLCFLRLLPFLGSGYRHPAFACAGLHRRYDICTPCRKCKWQPLHGADSSVFRIDIPTIRPWMQSTFSRFLPDAASVSAR